MLRAPPHGSLLRVASLFNLNFKDTRPYIRPIVSVSRCRADSDIQ